MKYRLLSIFAVAGLLLTGCAEIETLKESVSVIAVMEGEQTRTSVTDEGVFSWSAGDQVWLQTTSESVVGTLSSGAGTSRASFSTGAFIGDLTGKAVYPYNASHSISGDELSFVLPSSYDLGSNLTNTNAAMYGVDADGTIRFNHLAGVMRFVFKNAPAGTDKFQITLDKKINGVFAADLSEALPVIETSAASSESEKTVTLNFDALQSVSDICLYVPLPIGTYTALDLELWAGDKSLWSYSNTVTNKIGRKTLKLMPAVNMSGEAGGDIEGGDSSAEPQEGDYVDEYGINHGQGIDIDGIVWAPVNCGYHKDDFQYGKLYQWGRKYGQGYSGDLCDESLEIIGSHSDATIPTYESGGVKGATGSDENYANVFFIQVWEFRDWCDPQNEKLWYSGSEKAPVKTNYDPCPEGWRVPTMYEYEQLIVNHSSWVVKDGQSGCWFCGSNTYGEDVPKVFFPAAGYRSVYTAGQRGGVGYYWASTPNYDKDWDRSVRLNLGRNELQFANREGGYAVRCVREGTSPSTPSEQAVNLSQSGTANSYIVSSAGSYKFSTVKGNSSESVGAVSSAEVLWESFGTDVTPNVGDLVKNVKYADGTISFDTPSTFTEGNAVIAAKDASGTILWSWHIWLTDEPQGQEYYNNAGTMMDRNLGATSATPGDVGALGLLYQWGRKDPFLGSSSISSDIEAKSTGTWPSAVSSNSTNGTIEYATAYPTTFITYNSSNYDWYYTGSSTTDNTRWITSTTTKSIYDPCPSGWRVPDGGDNSIWSKALGSSSDFAQSSLYDSTNEGMNFSGKFGSDQTIWYPASGFRFDYDGGLYSVGSGGNYWSASPSSYYAYYLVFDYGGNVSPAFDNDRALGYSVRCVREGTSPSTPSEQAVNLSQSGTANSYIVSSAGSYRFSTVKGNSSESVGAVSSAEVLWESFGTDVTPNVGDLVKNVKYADGTISFDTPSTFTEGNAVIAAKDASGTILWSWHIWLTDEPQGQEYYNNAGTMMDRNLGATSATPGNVGALGLLYQWGRKDPFLGSSSISSSTLAKSTITWPSAVASSSATGTVDYAILNPTTFVTALSSAEYDWHYASRDNTLWTTSDKTKSIYDPCPAGWRVPDGGSNGIWSKAGFIDTTYDGTNEGISFSISSPSTTWYPASGYRYDGDGGLRGIGYYGNYWSASPVSSNAYYLIFYDDGVAPSGSDNRANGQSVRCLQESK